MLAVGSLQFLIQLILNTGPLVEPLKPLIWLQSFKTFNLAEKPLITFILIRKPLNFQDEFELKK